MNDNIKNPKIFEFEFFLIYFTYLQKWKYDRA